MEVLTVFMINDALQLFLHDWFPFKVTERFRKHKIFTMEYQVNGQNFLFLIFCVNRVTMKFRLQNKKCHFLVDTEPNLCWPKCLVTFFTVLAPKRKSLC